jgi:hypothetical protein
MRIHSLQHHLGGVGTSLGNCFHSVVVERYGNPGVRIFLVLSVYLITSQLVKERVTTGSILLRSFYARCAFRIIPSRLRLHVGGDRYSLERSLQSEHRGRSYLHRELLPAQPLRARPPVVLGVEESTIWFGRSACCGFSQPHLDCAQRDRRRPAPEDCVLAALEASRPRPSIPRVHGRFGHRRRSGSAPTQSLTASACFRQPKVSPGSHL